MDAVWIESLKKEVRKLKIENNRDEKDERVDTKNIHYGERKSRYGRLDLR